MADIKETCFKRIGTVDLKQPITGLEVSHKFGLTAVVISNQLHLINTEQLIQRNTAAFVNTNINAHLITSNEEYLAVANNEIVTLYSYTNFNQTVGVVNAKSRVKRMLFNPTDNAMITILSDQGNLTLAKVSAKGLENWALNDMKVTALCFSPKGKQLCVGFEDGHMSQLKLDLTVAKNIEGPPGAIPLSILWVSTTQFLTLYFSQQEINLVQVDAQKGSTKPLYNILGDVFISDEVNANSQAFFSTHSAETIVCSSTTSNEVVLLGKAGSHWTVSFVSHDERRANLPMDHFSIGSILYYNHQAPVKFTEQESYPPMPVYMLASGSGVISMFSLINAQGKGEGIKFEAGQTPLNLSAISFGGNNMVGQTTQQPVPATQPQQPPPYSFASITTATQVQPPSAFSFAPVTTASQAQPPPAFSFAPVTNATQGQPPPSFSFAQVTTTTQAQTPSTFSFAPVTTATSFQPFSAPPTATPEQASPFQGFGHSLKKVESQGNLSHASLEPKPLSATLPAQKTEAKVLPTEAQISQVKEKATELGGQLSESLLKQVSDFEKRLAKFQKLKAEYNAKSNAKLERVAAKVDTDLISQLNPLEDFMENIERTCRIHKKEIQDLREKHMAQYASLEYAKGLEERNKDPNYLQTLRSQPLDPMITKRFRTIERTVGYIRNQIQECRRHFYFSKYPPLNPDATVKYIYQTLGSHRILIQRLRNQNNLMREALGKDNSLSELTAGLKNTTLKDTPVNGTKSLKDLADSYQRTEDVKHFLARRTIIKLKKEYPDYVYSKEGVFQVETNNTSQAELKNSKGSVHRSVPSAQAKNADIARLTGLSKMPLPSPIASVHQTNLILTPTTAKADKPKATSGLTVQQQARKSEPPKTELSSSTPAASNLFSFGPTAAKGNIQPTVLFPPVSSVTSAPVGQTPPKESTSLFSGAFTSLSKDPTHKSEPLSAFTPPKLSGVTITPVVSTSAAESPGLFSFSTSASSTKPLFSGLASTTANGSGVFSFAAPSFGAVAAPASSTASKPATTSLLGEFPKSTPTTSAVPAFTGIPAATTKTSGGATVTSVPAKTEAQPKEAQPVKPTVVSPNIFQLKPTTTSTAVSSTTAPLFSNTSASSTPLFAAAFASSNTAPITFGSTGSSLFSAPVSSATVTAVTTPISSVVSSSRSTPVATVASAPVVSIISSGGTTPSVSTAPATTVNSTVASTGSTSTLDDTTTKSASTLSSGAFPGTTTSESSSSGLGSESTLSISAAEPKPAEPVAVVTSTVPNLFKTESTSTPSALSTFSFSTTSVFSSPALAPGIPTTTASAEAAPSPFGASSFSAFGSGAATTTAATVGTPSTTTASSLFGPSSPFANVSICSPTPATPSLFGSTATSTPGTGFGTSSSLVSPGNLFAGKSSTTPGTAASIFGAPPNVQSPTGTSIFGQPSGSLFGGTTPGTGTSIFGGSSTFGTAASGTSAFGSAAAPSSPFGAAAGTATSSPFGAAAAPSPFGAATGTATSSAFGAAAGTTASPFGAAAGGSSPFGAAASGGTGTTAGSIFGGSSTFSGGSVFGGSSTFGQQQQPKPAESIFGGNAFSGLGSSQPVGEVKNVFGGGSTFGTQNVNQGLFSNPTGAAPTSAFGSLAAKPPNPAFGAPSVFGSSLSAFGTTSPGTGGSVFGGGAVFGSFATASAGAGSGTAAPTSIFGGAAAQQNVGFGQLAQTPSAGIFGGGAGDASGSAFGGGSPFGGFSQQPQQQPQQQSAFQSSPQFSSWR